MDAATLVVLGLLAALILFVVLRAFYERRLAELSFENLQVAERFQFAESQLHAFESEIDSLQEQRAALELRLQQEMERRSAAEERGRRVQELDTLVGQLQRELITAKTAWTESEVRAKEEKKSFEEKIALLNHARGELSTAFKALSAEALSTNNRSFMDLAQQTLARFQEGAKTELAERERAIDTLVKPLRESLERFDGKVESLERVRLESYAGLTEQLKTLQTSEKELRVTTTKLVNALRAPHVRGRWGEMQLQRVVEMAGMVEYCDFLTQETSTSEDRRLRPDLIVRLPAGKTIIIDAKAPIISFIEALDAPDEETKISKLRDHARHIRNHLQQLSQKSYWDQFSGSPEFVVLFLPGETFFGAALEQDPSLIEFGVEQRVILATPTTLIALLRAVAYGWRQESLAENARDISLLGAELHDRLLTMTSHLDDMRKGLERAVEGYNRGMSSFESRVMVSARKLKALGATTNDDLPLLEVVEANLRLAPSSRG